MELTLLGVGLLLLIFSWTKQIRTAILDNTRDDLFDLREEVRERFLQTPAGLHHPLYNELRGLINGHIRYTEGFTFLTLVNGIYWGQKHKDTLRHVHAQINARFTADDPELTAYADKVRERAVLLMFEFAIKRSLIALAIACIAGVYMLAKRLLQAIPSINFTFKMKPILTAAAFSGILLSAAAHAGVTTPSSCARRIIEDGALKVAMR